MRISEAFPSKYLKAADLQGRNVRCAANIETIRRRFLGISLAGQTGRWVKRSIGLASALQKAARHDARGLKPQTSEE